jgi:hypothetical protein
MEKGSLHARHLRASRPHNPQPGSPLTVAKKPNAKQHKARDRKKKKRETAKRRARVRSVERGTPQARMRRAGASPLRECRVAEGWEENRLATVVISRDGPEGIAAAVFLVDLGCLGVKNCFAIPDLTWDDYRSLLGRVEENFPLAPCEPTLARKLVETGVRYAAELGFRPQKDYRLAHEIFGDIDAELCDQEIECGEEGKPIYVQGPDDDAEAILAQLEARFGPDGFHYVLEAGDPSRPSLLEHILGLAVCPEWDERKEEHEQGEADGGSTPAEEDRVWRRLRRCEGRLTADLLGEALERFDPTLLQEAWGEFTCWDDERFDASLSPELWPAFVDWLAFSWRPDRDDLRLRAEEAGDEDAELGAWPEAPLALEYGDRNASRLDAFEQRFLAEMVRPPRSFYAVVRVLDDRGLVLEDIFTRRQVEVRECTLTRSVKAGGILFARVFERERVAIVCGCAPIQIRPIYRAWLVDLREQIERAHGRADAEALHEYDFELRDAYFNLAEAVEHPPPPRLVNTDDEPVVPTRLHFELRCSPQAAFEKLAPLALDSTPSELLEEAGTDARGELRAVQIPWRRPGNRKHRDWTSAGRSGSMSRFPRSVTRRPAKPPARRGAASSWRRCCTITSGAARSSPIRPSPWRSRPCGASWGFDRGSFCRADPPQPTFSMSIRMARSAGIGCQENSRYLR